MKTKDELRKEISKLSKEILPKDDYRIIQSIELCKKILGSQEYKIADVIFVYMPLPDEVDLTRLIADSFVAGKTVCLPRIDDKKGNMTFHQITAETKLEEGMFDIFEPSQNTSIVDLDYLFENSSSKILVFVPGRAFTKTGKRLGRGGGYYDRFFQKYGDKVIKLGVCFPFQILDDIPTEETDCTVDKVIFE